MPRPCRILIVEDHAATARATAQLVAGWGYDVETVSSLHEAVQLLAEIPFDLLLADLGLAMGDGRDLMRHARDTHHLRGLAVTGYPLDQVAPTCKEVGFDHVLTKPVDPAALRNALEHVAALPPLDPARPPCAPSTALPTP